MASAFHSDSYDVWNLNSTTLAGINLKSGEGITGGSKSLTTAATNSILGSDPVDTVSGTGLSGTVTYVGTVTYTSNGFGTTTGFVVTDGSGNYYLVTLHSPSGAGYTPTTSTAQSLGGSVTTPPGTNGSGEWTISSSGGYNGPGCFLAGSMIATPAGEVPVESLAAGSLVLTADGRAMPVRWLGRTTVSRVFADPVRLLPVRIKAGALGENLPARDLLVSPGHAMLVDGVLVHAAALVNGTSIVREHDAPILFTYYHVELDTHSVLLAEGTPTESFLDGSEEMNFDNWADRVVPAAVEELAYPRAKSSRQVPAATRSRLAARAVALFGALAEAA